MAQHYPVLLEEVEQHLAIDPGGVYVDCTLGAAGYAERILSRLDTGRLIAIDRDETAIEAARAKLAGFGAKVTFYHGGFSEIERAAGPDADLAGVVADLGWSRTQVEDGERGFSFSLEGPLDGRYDRRQPLTTGQIVNHYPEKQLADLLFELGGERRSRRIARAIVRGRPVRSTKHLAELIEGAVPRAHWQRIHPATQSFQALRIAVNDELGELDALLAKAPALLAAGGRMVVVTFHSLEDRRVKQAFRDWASTGEYEVLTRRVVRASEKELDENPASRSAKLRALERKAKWARRN
ncbi:MAG: 16S rRNA (cytosine(1402)-N(4))-methyltransferase RsmH [Acidobacteria bacterium]|nr:16S rRNA (cytosine(1402)-N(4))-methyltransferase RsmH [Acidobacteriota bacterium]